MTYEESMSKNITTNATSRPNIAQIVIRNPQDADIFVNLIEILPNVDFALSGKLIILINGVPVLSDDSDSFRKYSKYPLSLGKTLERSQKIEIFAWNGNDTNSLQVDFNIHLSSEQKQIPSVAIPLSQDEKNRAISEFETILPLTGRAPGNYSNLIDMKGYRKLAVLLSAVVYVDSSSPIVIAGDFQAGQTSIVDGDLNTYQTVNLNPPTSIFTEFDFRTRSVRTIKIKFRITATLITDSSTVTVNIYTKNNAGDAYVQQPSPGGASVTGNNSQTANTQTSTVELSANLDFRYIKIVFVPGGIRIITLDLFEVYDPSLVGGTGSLSFELLNSANQWVTYIPSSEFGTIVQGSMAISKVLGDTIKSASGQEYPLPTTQSRFRANYTVIGGGIRNSIDIVRVS